MKRLLSLAPLLVIVITSVPNLRATGASSFADRSVAVTAAANTASAIGDLTRPLNSVSESSGLFLFGAGLLVLVVAAKRRQVQVDRVFKAINFFKTNAVRARCNIKEEADGLHSVAMNQPRDIPPKDVLLNTR